MELRRYKAKLLFLSMVSLLSAGTWLLALAHTLDPRANLLATSWTIISKTSFGRAFAARIVVAALACIFAFLDFRILLLTASAVLLLCEGGDGHMFAHGFLTGSVQALHVLAAGVWIGGLFPLADALNFIHREDDVVSALPLISLFSKIAFGAVMTIFATGVISLVIIRPSLTFSNLYIDVFAVKLVLVSIMLALALLNRGWLMPQLDKEKPQNATRMLIKSILWEQAIGITVLGVVAWLGELNPYVMKMTF